MKVLFLVLASVAIVIAIVVIAYVLLSRSQNVIARLDQISAWFGHRWPRIHTLAAPYGVALTALLLSVYLDEGEWQFWQSWTVIKDTASIAAIIYALIAISTEVMFTMFFFALGQVHKIIEQNRKARGAILEAQREEGREEERKEWQTWYDSQIARGVELPDPPPAAALSTSE